MMTDAKLKELFEQALAGEPPMSVPPDEDIARGRALRSRRRRTRAGIGAATLAVAWLGGLIVPNVIGSDDDVTAGVDAGERSDEVWPYDTPADTWFWDSPDVGDTALAESVEPASGGSQIEQELLAAVAPLLPADLTLESSGTPAYGPEHALTFFATRGGTDFSVKVMLQEARPDLGEFRPCTEPAQTRDDVAIWSPCEQGYDDDGRWRVGGQAGDHTGLAIVEGGTTAAAVVWDATINNPNDATEVVGDFADSLSFEEANAIAEAAWAVGAEHDEAELATGYDIDAVEQDWPRVQAALESVLGPLQEVEVDRPDPNAITSSYLTAAGDAVDLAVWQADRLYEHICVRKEVCDAWPGSADYFARLYSDNTGSIGGNGVPDRGRASLSIEGLAEDNAPDEFGEALAGVLNALDRASD